MIIQLRSTKKEISQKLKQKLLRKQIKMKLKKRKPRRKVMMMRSTAPDPYYPPIIYLPEIVVNSGEDGEEEMFKRRAKLYRYAHECSPPEWKERGTGDVKILKKEEDHSARILMRREKTLKVCANHSILPWMELKPNCGSQKAWVWKTQLDFADEEPKQETLAIRFGNVENAKKFFDAFEQMRNYVLKMEAKKIREEEGVEDTEKKDEQEKGIVKGNDAECDQNAVLSDKMADLVVESN
eukprot:GFUD01007332.1.p1 GENE.GFUD01007332.1~~GFUD01007332.1.p1  ORF type:complete len:239 (-),score=84.53 GFUD01007332.1:98-814(-)